MTEMNLQIEYAKIGTVDTTTTISANTIENQLQSTIENALYHKWKEKGIAYKHCRQTKRYFNGPDRLQSKKILKLGKNKLYSHNTGHNRTKQAELPT